MKNLSPITFAVLTDLHLDIMHDGMRRVRSFLHAASDHNVDFIISLGDFSYPKDTSTCLCDPQKMPVNLKLAQSAPTTIDKDSILALFNQYHKRRIRSGYKWSLRPPVCQNCRYRGTCYASYPFLVP